MASPHVPPFSPILVPEHLCASCGNKMDIVVERMNNGKITGLMGYCDSENCQYGARLHYTYASAETSIKFFKTPEARAAEAAEKEKALNAG